MDCMFSMVVPVYNVGSYLRPCLDSLVAAARCLAHSGMQIGLEVICVDDGSTDGSGRVLDEYGARFSDGDAGGCRWRVVHQVNSGVSAARNAALDAAVGDWVWCIDADDSIREDALVCLAEQIRNYASPVDVIFIGATSRRERLVPSGSAMCEFQLSAHTQDSTWRMVWNTVFRREKIGDLRFLPFRMGEDVIFIYSFLRRNPSGWARLPEVLYYHVNDRNESVTHKTWDESFFQEYHQFRQLLQELFVELLYPRGLCISWYPDQVFYSYKEQVYRADEEVVRKVFGMYVDELVAQHRVWPFCWHRALRIYCLRHFRWPWLGRVLIYYPGKVHGGYCRFLGRTRVGRFLVSAKHWLVRQH